MKLNSNAINKMTINPKNFGNKNILFKEKDRIEKSILKIKAFILYSKPFLLSDSNVRVPLTFS